MNLGNIDLGDSAMERAAFFGALGQLGGLGADLAGLGADDLGSTALAPNPAKSVPVAFPPKSAVEFPDPDGQYKYRAETSGTFTITAAPPDKKKLVGKVVKQGQGGFDDIKAVYMEFAEAAATGERKAAKAAKTAKTADTAAAILKGVSAALPSFTSAAAAATAPAPDTSSGSAPEKEEGWGALQWGLLVGGIVVAGGVSFLLYRTLTAPAAPAAKE